MTEESNKQQETRLSPTIGEYKGKPTLRLPLVENPDENTSWHWMTFGKSKAKAIVKYFEDIKKFAAGE